MTPTLPQPVAHDVTRGWGRARVHPVIAAVLAGMLATLVSVIGISTPSLWGDEVATLMSAQRSWPELWAMLGHVDAVHGVYYAFMHVWIDAFGASPFSLRLPSALAVGFATAGLFELLRRSGRPGLGLLAAAVFVVLPRTQYMAGEARSYAMAAALAVWLTVALLAAVRSPTVWRWTVYGALTAVSLAWFAYLALIPLAHGIVLVSGRLGEPGRGRRHAGAQSQAEPQAESQAERADATKSRSSDRPLARIRAWLTATVAAVLIVSPLLLIAFGQRGQLAWIASSGVNGPVQALVETWFGTIWCAAVCWALIIGLLIVTWRGRLRSRADGALGTDQIVALSAAWACVPLLLLWGGSLFAPVFSARYLSMSAPAVAILLAVALTELWRWRRLAAVLAGLLVLALAIPALVAQRGPYAKNGSDWSQLSDELGAAAKPGDAVVFDDSGYPWLRPRLALHAYPAGFTALDNVTGLGLSETDVWDTNVLSVGAAAASDRMDGVSRVWLVARVASTDQSAATELAAMGFHEVEQHTIVTSEFSLWQR